MPTKRPLAEKVPLAASQPHPRSRKRQALTGSTGNRRAQRNGRGPADLAGIRGQIQELRAALAAQQATIQQLSEKLLRREEEFLRRLYATRADQIIARFSGEAAARQIEYQQLVRRVREAVRTTLPCEAVVAVASRGDDDFLDLYRRQAWHFPQNDAGVYAGFYPAGSLAAIAHLESLRARGATHLLFPATAWWWLEKYDDFRKHLDSHYRVVVRDAETCLIFSLHEAAEPGIEAAQARFGEMLAVFRYRHRRDAAVLDCGSGLGLAECFPCDTIFAPETDACPLPYLDHSIDIVVAPREREELCAEAARVAEAVVVFAMPATSNGPYSLDVQWCDEGSAASGKPISVIIPAYDGWRLTAACLATLRETVPAGFDIEIIVVDDASTDETSARLAEMAAGDRRIKVLRNTKNAGFLRSVNRGAKAARGELLLFLNNDVVLLPGWLPPLVQTFEDFRDAGAVGGKLLFPDGRLQEAGGVVFCDGSAAHFGRDDYALDSPLYAYIREVDYCSGAMLATPRRLFEELGGFDPIFSPGYYEDTDYCFRLRSRGYRVYYQPESAAVHFEGATAGTDGSRGMRRYFARNRKKFAARWHDALARHADRPGGFDQDVWKALALRTPDIGDAAR